MSQCSDCSGCGSTAVVEFPRSAVLPQAVAVIGPPNSGKTTLFNRLTGLRQKVANFPGVTVEQHTGIAELPDGRAVRLIDLPGVYSLSPRSEDEQVAFDVLTGARADTPKPEAILLVLDSTNLARHLMLAAPILALGVPTLVILNMADDLRSRGGKIDTAALSAQLGAPVALIAARKGEGVDRVFDFLAGVMPKPAPKTLPILQDVPKCRAWAGQVGTEAKYRAPLPPKWTRRLDSVLLHPVFGPLIFAAVVVLVFQTIFTYATPLMDAVKWMFAVSGNWIASVIPAGLLRDLLVNGVWKGVGSVVVFLPQVLLLFLFIGLLEDSGYLARAALIADRTMAKVGLQGKSFIPLLSAYACAVPAILATRTIENKRDRMATILVAPFMTCSARLPVYALIVAAFIPNHNLLGGILSTQTAAMLGLYLLGFLAAVFTARVLKSSILKSGRTPFLLEMPSYRWPTWQSIGLRLLDRSKVFLRRAGTVILLVTVLLWAASNVPFTNGHPPNIADSVAGTIGRTIEPVIKPLGFNWKIGVGLLTSLAARETIIATLGFIYGMNPDSNQLGLQQAIQHDLTPGGAFALLVFFAFAMQCISTIAVVRRETGGWKWPILQFTYMSVLAWVGAFVANHLIR
ncbi:MAG TPA: ferrous iron transporter B [Candidatus Sulfopaludibacter sp.]|jgi:ferrous iron transport protein B|nr:ferrous iron transporter B [Candidatus Sulfopaludibacter sp.]